MIATESRVLIWEPLFSVDGCDPLHFSLRVCWDSKESFSGALTSPVSAAYRTASVRHLNGRGDKKRQQPITCDPQ